MRTKDGSSYGSLLLMRLGECSCWVFRARQDPSSPVPSLRDLSETGHSNINNVQHGGSLGPIVPDVLKKFSNWLENHG